MSTAPKTHSKKRGLGRGLDALFQEEESTNYSSIRARDTSATPATESRTVLKIDQLQPGKYQPRRRFDDEALGQLVASIKVHGVLQPLLVRPLDKANTYEIIAGERRWRAAQQAQLHDVPVVIQNLSDSTTLEIALIENLQREDLTPLEEADGYQNLIDEFDYTQDTLARNIGKSRSHIANTLRLLGLPDAVKQLLQAGQISAGHGRAVLAAKEPARLAAEVVKKGLSVRQTEKLAAKSSNYARTRTPRPGNTYGPKDVDTLALEKRLSEKLGLKVTLDIKETGGTLSIQYKTLDQLDDVIKRLDQ